MTTFDLQPIDTVDNISREAFREEYLFPSRPVLVKGGISQRWPAYDKWDWDYLKDVAGAITVPLIDNEKVGSASWASAAREMTFAAYLDLITSQRTELHLFALNILRSAGELCNDFQFPEYLMRGFIKQQPLMFFGGAGSVVHLHYDPDMSNLLHTQFRGRKKVLLFGPSQSAKLYKLPGLVHSPIDAAEPDQTRYPHAREARGFEIHMEHGDTLLIPSGWWHYMEYLEPGFALTLRAISPFASMKVRGAYQTLAQHGFDKLMRKLCGPRWFRYQVRTATKRAERATFLNRKLIS